MGQRSRRRDRAAQGDAGRERRSPAAPGRKAAAPGFAGADPGAARTGSTVQGAKQSEAVTPDRAGEDPSAATASPRDRMAERYARARAKDAAVRVQLKPLAAGERPGAVTVAAVVAALLVPLNITAAFLTGDSSAQLPVALLQSLVLLVAAWGIWRAKYWAVLGFEALLAIQIISFSLALLVVENPLYATGLVALIAGLGLLFYKLIRAMARIQMPGRGPRDHVG